MGDDTETKKHPPVEGSVSPSIIADRFVGENNFVTLLEKKESWYYDFADTIWKPEGESYLLAWINQNCPNISKNDFNEVRFLIQSKTIVMPEHFKPNPQILNFAGKHLSLKYLNLMGTDAYGPKDWYEAQHFMRIRLDTKLDLGAPPPRLFLQALQKAIPDGRDLYHCLQAFSTILLIRTMRIEKAFFFLGSGGNGKSTIMKAVENIFNPYISHVDLGDLVKDRFASAALVDKLANVYADIQSLRFKDMAIFKAISSGDTISVGDKYERRHDETIKVIQIYSANKMPYIDDKNKGFLRRVSPIVFDMVIEDQDPYIDDKLADPDEQTRILALLIRIAKVTKARGFLFEKSEADILEILEEKEDPITQFLNDPDWIRQEPEQEMEKHLLYNLYRTYCRESGCAAKQMNAFSRYLTNKGFATRRSNGRSYAIGLSSDRVLLKPKVGQETL